MKVSRGVEKSVEVGVEKMVVNRDTGVEHVSRNKPPYQEQKLDRST